MSLSLLRLARISLGLLMLCFASPAFPENHTVFEEPENRPRVTRFACCEGVEIRDDATQSGTVIGQLDREELVYVFNIFGAGLPSGLIGCTGTAAPCGTFWAEIYASEQGIEGFVPLNALFVRELIGQPNRLQYEISYQLIFDGLRRALRETVISPPNCGDEGNVELYRGSDLPGDWIMSPDRNSRTSCDQLIAIPDYTLISCDEMDEDNSRFQDCRYRNANECTGDRPTRGPSQDLSFCSKTHEPRRAQCQICRDWYALTGQDSSGWKTSGEIVDQCLARFEPGQVCILPGGGGGGGGGGGVDVPSAGSGFAQTIDDGEFDPTDIPGAPEPLVVTPELPSVLTNPAAPQSAQSDCVGLCMEQMQTWRASSCRNYIGSADRKYLADHQDYACRELPIGKTHPLMFLNMDTGDLSGSPDETWKWLQTADLGGDKLVIKIGRLGKQTSYLTQINDMTREEEGRYLNIGSQLSQDHFWFRMKPALGDWLEFEICALLPGMAIETVPVRPDTTSDLGLWVEEIDLGGLEIDRAELCQEYSVRVNDDYALRVRPYRFGDLDILIEPDSYTGANIQYTALTNGATVIAPVVNILLVGLQIGTEVAEAYLNNGYAEALAQILVIVYEDTLRTDLVDALQDTLDAGVDDLNATVDAPDLLNRMCGTLAPNVRQSNPTFWFNQFLLWQCEGFADDPNLRAFIPHAQSEIDGCYREGWYINPQDSRAAQWWTPYAGQSWAYNFVGTPDRGCRIAGEVSSTLDRDTWPTMICAMAMYNSWMNGPNFGNNTALTNAIQNNCGGTVNQALGAYYGDGNDLVDLYARANAPVTPGTSGGFRLE